MQRTTLYTASLLVLAFATLAEERHEPEVQIANLPLAFVYEHHFGADRATLREQARWVSEADLLVALELQHQTRIELERIIGWRRDGASWDDIARQCGLHADAFYVALPNSQALSGPYVRPYSVWRQTPGADLQLTDEEVRELVLLRTLRDFCQLPATDVVRLRVSGRSPEAIVEAHGPQREAVRSSLQPPLPQEPRQGGRKP
jgi:hypothetical protein